MSVRTYALAQLLRALPRKHISEAVGRAADTPLPAPVSRALVGLYARAYAVDLSDAAWPNGGGTFPSFDAFFTRALRTGARPTAGLPGDVVSPADGRLDALGAVTTDGVMRVKGQDYGATDLVGDAGEAARFAGGQFAVIYLSPRDYHRVHAPAKGEVRLVRSLPGDFFPVNRIGERHVTGLLARNRRVATFLTTPGGELALVMVAAMIVGRITMRGFPERDVPLGDHPLRAASVARGEELGIFHLGSTVVLLQSAGSQTWTRALGPIRLGETLSPSEEARGGGQ